MAYEAATQALIDTLEAIAETKLTRIAEMSSGFKHDPDFDPEQDDSYPNRDRTFAIWARRGASDLRSMNEATQVQFDAVQIAVFYNRKRSLRDIDVAVRADYKAIREALRNQSNWDRGTTGIQLLTVGTGIEGYDFDVQPLPGGSRLLVINIDLRHTNQTS